MIQHEPKGETKILKQMDTKTVEKLEYILRGTGILESDKSEIIDLIENYAQQKAIAFADYVEKLSPANRVSFWSKDGQVKGLFSMDNEQLFERFQRF